MMSAEFISTKSCILYGVGRLTPNKPIIVSEHGIRQFERMHGQKIGRCKLPGYIQLTLVLERSEP